MKKQLIIEAIAFLLIVLFLYASIIKVMEYQKFHIQVNQSPILTGFGDFVPSIVIGLEVIAVVLIITPSVRLIGFYLSFCLMVMFTTYISLILAFSPYVPCSCGGILEKMGWTEHLIFNVTFIILCLAGIVLETKAQANLT